MTISTLKVKPPLSTSPNVPGNRSKYRPVELSEDTVFELAGTMTQLEIADLFMVSDVHIAEKYSNAYRAGRAAVKQKRRNQLGELIDRLAQDMTAADPDEHYDHRNRFTKTDQLIFALTQWQKAYDPVPKEVIEEDKDSFDGVESKPKILEKPLNVAS